LLHLQVLDPCHFSVLVDHPLNYVVDLFFLLQVLVAGFLLKLLALLDLLLDVKFVVDAVLDVALVCLSLDLVLDFFGPQHDFIDLSVLFLSNNNILDLRC
jgi:hypothetical protein